MLSEAKKEDIVATFVIELDRMMAIIRHQYRLTKDTEHQDYISLFEDHWRSELKAESEKVFDAIENLSE